MTLPNFLYIGPDKTGSTWMYKILKDHPQVFVPVIKDIYFFDRHFDKGVDWYSKFFASSPTTAQAIGELSHDYLFSVHAADRIATVLPGVRLLTCLRDPLERSISHYLYLRRSGLTDSSFEGAVRDFPEIVANSLYGRHLTEYLRRFEEAQIHVLYFEQLRRDPVDFARSLFKALDLDFISRLPYSEIVLPASKARYLLLARLAKVAANKARALGFAGLVGRVKTSSIASLLYTPTVGKDTPAIPASLAADLRGQFSRDLEQIRGFTGDRTPPWMS